MSRNRRGKTVVDRISFEIRRGDFCAMLGRNGAGTTTTLRMLVGRTLPTSDERIRYEAGRLVRVRNGRGTRKWKTWIKSWLTGERTGAPQRKPGKSASDPFEIAAGT
ncbi:MAG: ATP-binding cassette domain-containing protein [Methylococcales bacterium]